MGLIKTGLMLGGGAYALNRVTKSYEATHAGQPGQYNQQPAQYAQSQRAVPGHQPFCNGSCGGTCVPADGYLHASFCNGSCGHQCNPAGQRARATSPMPRMVDDAPQQGGSMPWQEAANGLVREMAGGRHEPPAYKR